MVFLNYKRSVVFFKREFIDIYFQFQLEKKNFMECNEFCGNEFNGNVFCGNEFWGNEFFIVSKFQFYCCLSVVDFLYFLFVLFIIVFFVLKVCKLFNVDENVVLIFVRCLFYIVFNVLLNKREVRNVKSC